MKPTGFAPSYQMLPNAILCDRVTLSTNIKIYICTGDGGHSIVRHPRYGSQLMGAVFPQRADLILLGTLGQSEKATLGPKYHKRLHQGGLKDEAINQYDSAMKLSSLQNSAVPKSTNILLSKGMVLHVSTYLELVSNYVEPKNIDLDLSSLALLSVVIN